MWIPFGLKKNGAEQGEEQGEGEIEGEPDAHHVALLDLPGTEHDGVGGSGNRQHKGTRRGEGKRQDDFRGR